MSLIWVAFAKAAPSGARVVRASPRSLILTAPVSRDDLHPLSLESSHRTPETNDELRCRAASRYNRPQGRVHALSRGRSWCVAEYRGSLQPRCESVSGLAGRIQRPRCDDAHPADSYNVCPSPHRVGKGHVQRCSRAGLGEDVSAVIYSSKGSSKRTRPSCWRVPSCGSIFRRCSAQRTSIGYSARPNSDDKHYYRDRAILNLMYATGARASEVSSLTLPAVSLANRHVRLLARAAKNDSSP